MAETGNGEMLSREKKVMVAIDESESSYYALIWALENLKDSINASGTPLLIFAARPAPQYNQIFAASLSSARAFTLSAPPELAESLQEQNRKVIAGILEKAKGICATQGVTAETVIEVGDPRVAICEAVLKYKINMLVVGDRGMGKIKRAIIGSVSNYCVLNAACSVLVVKKPIVGQCSQ